MRRYALQWNDKNLNLNFLKVCRIKSLKVYFIFLSFQNLKKEKIIIIIINKNKRKKKKDYTTQKQFNSQKKEKEERKRRKKKEKKKRKLIKIAIGILNTSHVLSSTICRICIYIYIYIYIM